MVSIDCEPHETVMITPEGIFIWDGNHWYDEDGIIVGDRLHDGYLLLETEGNA